MSMVSDARCPVNKKKRTGEHEFLATRSKHNNSRMEYLISRLTGITCSELPTKAHTPHPLVMERSWRNTVNLLSGSRRPLVIPARSQDSVTNKMSNLLE